MQQVQLQHVSNYITKKKLFNTYLYYNETSLGITYEAVILKGWPFKDESCWFNDVIRYHLIFYFTVSNLEQYQ